MKPLSEMTREELWALEDEELAEVLVDHAKSLSALTLVMVNGRGVVKEYLNERRLELQQDKAAK